MRRCRLMLIRIGTLWWKKRPFRPGRRSVGRQLRWYAGRIGRLLPVSTKAVALIPKADPRSEEHTSELQSLMRISYAVFCLNKKTKRQMKNTASHVDIQYCL